MSERVPLDADTPAEADVVERSPDEVLIAVASGDGQGIEKKTLDHLAESGRGSSRRDRPRAEEVAGRHVRTEGELRVVGGPVVQAQVAVGGPDVGVTALVAGNAPEREALTATEPL